MDRSGNATATYSYDVYGTRTQTSGSVNVSWGFTGREHDETGVIKLRNRDYVPLLASFMEPDRIGMGGGNNYYEYVSDRPTSSGDPYGYAPMLYTSGAIRELHDYAGNIFAYAVPGSRIQTTYNNLVAHGFNDSWTDLFPVNLAGGTINPYVLDQHPKGRLVGITSPDYCKRGQGQIWTVIDFEVIDAFDEGVDPFGSEPYKYPEEVVAHELGHAFVQTLLAPLQNVPVDPDDNSYTYSDEMACTEELDAHMAMYGSDTVTAMRTWAGCSHKPGIRFAK